MTVRITHIDFMPLNADLVRPFTIATGRLERVTNVAVRVQLNGGAQGWAECPVLPPVTPMTQAQVLGLMGRVRDLLVGAAGKDWRELCAVTQVALVERATVLAALQMAICDAYARDLGQPLLTLFGGRGHRLDTDITIPICPADEAQHLAGGYQRQGFEAIKTKIGCDLDADLRRIEAIRQGFPGCALILDANEGFTADQALSLLDRLEVQGLAPVLFEQPVARDDWAGLARVVRSTNVPIAADESCRSPADARRIVDEGLADVINIKLAKVGVLGALEIIDLARAHGLGLMIGAMVETRLGCGGAAHLVAGAGGFDFIDLDTALLMARDPIVGGYALDGPRISLDRNSHGHGMRLQT